MKCLKLLALPALATVLLAISPAPASAGVFSVAPIRVFMTVRDRAVAITLSNEGDAEIVLQADLHGWSQRPDGSDQLVPTDDLILAPPIVKLAPKAQQVVRLALLRPPDASRQLTYRLIVREVPEASSAARTNAMEIPVALALNLPIFVSPPMARRNVTCQVQRGGPAQVQALCRNEGNAYAQVREARLRRAGAETARFEGGSYILPGVAKPIALAAGAAVPAGPAELSVAFDDGTEQVFEVAVP